MRIAYVVDEHKNRVAVIASELENSDTERWIDFAVSACSPLDKYKNKKGRNVAINRLKQLLKRGEAVGDLKRFASSVVLTNGLEVRAAILEFIVEAKNPPSCPKYPFVFPENVREAARYQLEHPPALREPRDVTS